MAVLRGAMLGGLALGMAAGVAGCRASSEPLASTTIVGDFGGDRAALHADAAHATVDRSCATISIATPLTTNSSGAFESVGSRRRVGGVAPLPGEGSTPVRVSGRAFVSDGGTIQLIISAIPEEPGAPIGPSDTLWVVRNRASTLLPCP